jgi:CRP/FNR family nitrogen fixation transcriptional regulator
MFDAAPLTHDHSRKTAAVMSQPASRLEELLGGPALHFSAGQEVYAEGDKAGALYRVAHGVIRVYRLLADGRRQICAFHMKGEVFGFEAGAERHFFADAVTDTDLRSLRLGSEVELAQELLKLSLKSLAQAHDHLLTVGRNDAAGRVAAFLLEMAERQDSRVTKGLSLPMSRSDIADYLGLTIETVSRVMTRLKDARVIRLPSARQVEILDWQALADMTA